MDVKNVGISAIQIYFPKNVVRQDDFEKYCNVAAGKYTVGLGQQEMGFCSDNEDIVSISLTVTDKLLRDYDIDRNSIGFLAVGSETLIDKSKSVKTELMRLFPDNTDIEGVDVKNACYGGTQAVFHAIDWVYANYNTERRNAIAVLSDIAVYEEGSARCTGGVGAIAVLITPEAPIAFERGLRGIHMTYNWDFYKPICKKVTEYPLVDGHKSLKCYMDALDNSYSSYKRKAQRLCGIEPSVHDFDALMFHSPFVKMVQKAVGRMAYSDFLQGNYQAPEYEQLKNLAPTTSVDDGDFMKVLLKAADPLWKEKTEPNIEFNRRIGNMYTSSLFAQLVKYISKGIFSSSSRILFFAYGSGSASATFSATVISTHESLSKMQEVCQRAVKQLDHRDVHSCSSYYDALNDREKFLIADVPYIPRSLSDSRFSFFDNTFFLASIDELYRRSYSQLNSIEPNGQCNTV
ncbi:unnamed protein product [Auanema sp. JU1783]|nr:unnamed protein product [Auanema sp. JU1783]